MPRHGWTRSEEQFLIDNYESMTTEELAAALDRRTKKSINRKIEKLRLEGRIGHRSRETVKRAYYQRTRGNVTSASEETEDRPTRKRRGRRRKSAGLPVEEYDYEEV